MARTLVWLTESNWTKQNTWQNGKAQFCVRQNNKKYVPWEILIGKKRRIKKIATKKNSTILSQYSKFSTGTQQRHWHTLNWQFVRTKFLYFVVEKSHQCSQHSQKQTVLQTIQIANWPRTFSFYIFTSTKKRLKKMQRSVMENWVKKKLWNLSKSKMKAEIIV